MSIYIYQQLALQIRQFKNINMKQQGNYCLRFHFYYKDKQQNKIVFSTPTSIFQINGNSSQQKNRGQIIDNYYLTSPVHIKYEEQKILLDQICIFRNQLDSKLLNGDVYLLMYCQLMMVDLYSKEEDNLKKCSQFCAEIKNIHLAEFLQINFQDRYASIITGSLHMIAYKCEFKSNQERVLRLRSLNKQKKEKYHIQNRNQFTKESPIFRTIDQYITFTPKKEAQQLLQFFLNLTKDQSKKIELLCKKYIKILQQKVNSITVKDIEEMYKCFEQEKQRKRIFQDNSLKNFDTKMHKLANKIYHIWTKLIQILPQISEFILPILQKQYYVKIKEKWGQSIVRHEIKQGDWTVEKYENSGQQHILMSKKIRKTCLDESFNLNIIDKGLFPDEKIKPIMFQQIYLKSPDISTQEQRISKPHGKHLIIFVHGLGACRFDMEKISNIIKSHYSNIDCFISCSNEGRTDGDIFIMGQRLFKQVNHYINQLTKQPNKISFIGHSMGGLIIRAALPKLQAFRSKFYSYITLSSPHVGYLYNSSKLIDAGLWIINNVQKCQSILQLTMQDNTNIQQTLMYKLSSYKGLQWFQNIVLFSSYQDSYVPFESARIQKTKQTINDQKNNSQKGKKYNEMVQNIINRLKCNKLHRIDINFEIPQQNIDNLIGRTAHIRFLNCKYLLKMFITTCEYFFN